MLNNITTFFLYLILVDYNGIYSTNASIAS
jgi:hypothetical protein